MSERLAKLTIPDEVILSKIYLIRDQKVMLDRDLANLYGIETKELKRSCRRNATRFPIDFMFEMTMEELQDWRSQFLTSESDRKGLRYSPFCFTEHGVIMLASVLNSERAVKVNIQIVRIFIKLRKVLASNQDILLRLEKAELGLSDQENQIMVIFEYLKQLELAKIQEVDQRNRERIGFKRKHES